MKDRVRWQTESYSRYWSDQALKYGFDDYCKGLCHLVEAKKPSRIYEMAIGTGWPFATTFHEKGVDVTGSDISDLLVDQLRRRNPAIKAKVASYEQIDSSCAGWYDVVYCFRSTWYFPDIFWALDTMFSLTKEGGWVLFDIMNADSPYVKNTIRRHRLVMPYTIAKNIVKTAANYFLGKGYLVQDLWDIHELPVSVAAIEEYLVSRGVTYKKYSINQITDGLDEPFATTGEFESKIVFECRR